MRETNLLISSVIVIVIISTVLGKPCIPRKYTFESIVCVCNETYCDTVPKVKPLKRGHYMKFTSSESGLRFQQRRGEFKKTDSRSLLSYEITIKPDVKFQRIDGFGGHFTDAAGINIRSLSKGAQEKLMESYYSDNGIEYSMGRVPMGGTDFSIAPYTYDDEAVDDKELKHFKLAKEDFTNKIPYIQKANFLRKNQLNLIATPWTPPPWMKTSNKYAGGSLKEEYYQTYADYYVKFFEAYEEQNITFWGLTTGNEPTNGLLNIELPSMIWTPVMVANWIKTNLGPTIRNSTNYSKTKIIIHDDQRVTLPALVLFFMDHEALKYVDGVGVHWYSDWYSPGSFINFGKTSKKDLFLILTEATEGLFKKPSVALGSWQRAENYIQSIIWYLESDSTGWLDWNLALSLDGGPVFTGFTVDSPVIVNKTANEFYKQPTFYAMGHFSKFVVANSHRIDYSVNKLVSLLYNVRQVVFKRPDGGTVLVLYNSGNSDSEIVITDPKRGSLNIVLQRKSLTTLLYW